MDCSKQVTNMVIEVERLVKEVPLPESRKIVDLARFVEDIRRVERHTMICNFGGSLVHTRTEHMGISSVLHYRCCKILCCATEYVWTSNPESIHMDSVWGALSIGIGHSQSEELFAVIQTQYMSATTYQKYERLCGTLMKQSALDSIKSAIGEEMNAAIAEGSVNEDGAACITVIVDGGWCKRSYGHSYDANSGVAVIIGDRTKKVLFAGVRNKFCCICKTADSRGVEARKHACNANWAGSSTAMEADIIVEGLRWLQDDHGIICTKIVGDGDSSVMAKIRERMSYAKKTPVTKIECANHAVRNFRKKIEAAANNTKAFPGKDGLRARNLLKKFSAKLTSHTRLTISNFSAGGSSGQDLQKALHIIPYHIFGQHGTCPETFNCNVKPEDDHVPLLKHVGMWQNIEDAIIRLSAMAGSLIKNKTNNPAEIFMSAVSKTSGAKRVDYSKGMSYSRRVNVAVLAYNKPGQAWHQNTFKKMYKRSPKSPMSRMILKRYHNLHRRQLTRCRRRLCVPPATSSTSPSSPNDVAVVPRVATKKNTAGPDLEYGACDADSPLLASLCSDYYTRNVTVTEEKRKEIEEQTRLQVECPRWTRERRLRITASNAKKVARRRDSTPSANLVRQLLYSSTFSSEATDWGSVKESVARDEYEKVTGLSVAPCGLFVDLQNPFLAASPDGIVHNEPNDPYIVEIKAPFNARHYATVKQACEESKKFPLSLSKGQYNLPRSHEHFFQVQVQMQCCDVERCDYVVYLPNDIEIVQVKRDREFMATIMPKLKSFYMDCVLPELADSRIERGMPLREPMRIMEAKRRADGTKEKKM